MERIENSEPRERIVGTPVGDLEPDEALAFLRERLAGDGARQGRLILVGGSVASGKTRLLDGLLDAAARAGVRALSATGTADERLLPYGIADQLVSDPGMPRAAAEQARRAVEALQDAASGDAVEGAPTGATAHLVRRLARAFLEPARDEPLLVAIDDVHLADDASVLLLRCLQRRLRSTELTLVVTFRDCPGIADRPTDFALQRDERFQLTPMSERAVRDLMAARLGDDLVNGTLPALVRRLGAGIPMLVDALVDDYIVTGSLGEEAAAGKAYSAALAAYLDRWDLPLRETAGAIAVFGAAPSTEVVAGLAGTATDAAGDAIGALTACGLLVDDRFRHAITASAVLTGLSPAARASMHLRAAELKLRRAEPPAHVAEHLIAAGSAEPPWAIAVLQDAATQAVDDDRMDFAQRCLELALASTTTDADRRPILGALARCTWRTSPATSRTHIDALLDLAPDSPAPSEGTETAAVARTALWQGDEAGFRRSWDASAGRLDTRTAAELRLAREWWFGPSDDGSPAPHPDDDPWQVTATALSRIWRESGNDASTTAAERILRSCTLSDASLEALTTALLALVYAGRPEEARSHWRSLKAEADRRGAVTWQAVLGGLWAGAALRAGDVAYAAELARHTLSLLPGPDWGAAIGDPLATLVLAYTAAEEYDRAAEVLARRVPAAVFRTVGGIRYVRARGHYHLATGRLLAAVDDFEECRRLLAARGGDLPVIAPWRADLAAANLRLGNIDAARDLAARQLDLAAGTDAYTRALSLRTLALTTEPAQLPGALAQCAEMFAASGDQWEARRTSRILEKLPQRRTAATLGDRVAPFRSAESAASRQAAPVERMVLTRNAVPAAAAPVGVSATAQIDRGRGALEKMSAAEARVARLAARGLTNQQISSSLFITVSTVEQHLTRVYRKLGIRNRTLLAAKLGAE
ncbi:helix-turn-helix transcriptional regulator [Actinomadura opuntiae]|uniref:helix-turn-helix transcriptional regulator n=1 Tax=Actinomadura sp. OS1-43 TaxID=604315 RepID=UPI00255A9A6B|nr:AAA family ATPase [Actinomadura sp. OS1-43]MDL4818699.1 AAA family ATPase [Actinomadura sp. OS1-43]